MKQLLGFLLALTIPTIAVSQQCSNGQVYQFCGTACPLTCANRNSGPRPCTLQCVQGCFCPNGMAEHEGSCYNPDNCPAATTPPPPVPPPACSNGMVHETCGTACPLTCANRNDPPRSCTLQCVVGCFCPNGMAEHEGSCYNPDNCPAPTPSPPDPTPAPTCTNNMIYSTCGTACPLTCENRHNPPAVCPTICVKGCFCPSGMAEYGGSCYNPDACPITANTTVAPPPPTRPTCTNNMIYSTCGTACPLTCEQPNLRPCPRICARGCFCPQGLLEYDGRCVEREECPSANNTCTNGMIFNECGTACPLTCEQPNPRPCPRICARGCFCPQGLLEYDGRCVERQDCPLPNTTVAPPPPTRPTCTNNMIYSTCGTACPLTCENRNDPPRPCPAICVIGCTCPFGMAEHEGSCINPDNCPAPVNTTAATTTAMPTTTPPCYNGMVFSSCGTACPPTCNDPEPRVCIQSCMEGCFCPPGLLLHLGNCIQRSECPVVTPPPPCFNGMVFETCGTACPATCASPQPSICTDNCVEGCFCPSGLVLHLGRCIQSSECPGIVNTTSPTTTEVVATNPTTPTCTNGMVFNSCGTACPLTCDQPNPRPCIRICVQGCFCPEGLLENDGTCVPASDCPATTTPTPPTCPEGKEYRECGPVCPPTCQAFSPCFSLRCFPGCFCPEGQMEHEGRCVSECPLGITTPPPPLDPCDDSLITCMPHEYCLVNRTNNRGMCVPYPYCKTANCREDQDCEVLTSGCGPEDSFCNMYPQCKDPPYVPCGSDAFLACDSEWTYCLQQNKTRRASCVSDCFSRNGNCDEDDVCITTVSEGESPRIQCMESDDLPSDCPAGQVFDNSDCPSPCQETCDDVVQGVPTVCATVCAPPTCVCPRGLVRFRDRCVDPRLCYVLLTYPPKIQPLPIVDPNSVLLSLYSPNMDQSRFRERHQNRLISGIQSALADNGHHDVDVGFHGVHYDDDQLQIVIQLSGNSISLTSVSDLISILNRNSDDLGIPVEGFSQVEVVYVDDDEMSLSEDAIIGIAVSSGVAGIAVVVAWIAVVTCCCVLKGRRRALPPKYEQAAQGEKFETNVFFREKDLYHDPEKGKMVLESLCD